MLARTAKFPRTAKALGLLAFLPLCGLPDAALADDAPAPKLPTFALNPDVPWTEAGSTPSSPWSGLYVGSEVFASSVKGHRGQTGGSVYVGYNHEFDNNFVIGIDASTGFATSSFRHGPFAGYDFAATNVKLGYDMGRLMPFITAGVALAKPTSFGYSGAGDSLNDLFGGGSNFRGIGMVGAGFNYAITNNLSVGVAVQATTNRGGILVAP